MSIKNAMKKKPKRGRPELPDSQKRKPLGIPFSDDELHAIRKAAVAAGQPVAVFIRDAVLHRMGSGRVSK